MADAPHASHSATSADSFSSTTIPEMSWECVAKRRNLEVSAPHFPQLSIETSPSLYRHVDNLNDETFVVQHERYTKLPFISVASNRNKPFN